MPVTEGNLKIHAWKRSVGKIKTHHMESRDHYLQGIVYTPNGIVEVYSQYTRPITTHLCMTMGGAEYNRWIDRFHSARYLVTLATRFAEEVAEISARTTW